MMIRESLAHNLPEPDFAQRGGEFTVALWRDWLTDEVLAGYMLNTRQKQAIDYLKINRRITNREYKELTGSISQTALRDLRDLMAFGLVDKVGSTGRSTYYRLRKKPDTNPTNPT
jgi:ATP-dependent DNA helicase RecG